MEASSVMIGCPVEKLCSLGSLTVFITLTGWAMRTFLIIYSASKQTMYRSPSLHSVDNSVNWQCTWNRFYNFFPLQIMSICMNQYLCTFLIWNWHWLLSVQWNYNYPPYFLLSLHCMALSVDLDICAIVNKIDMFLLEPNSIPIVDAWSIYIYCPDNWASQRVAMIKTFLWNDHGYFLILRYFSCS